MKNTVERVTSREGINALQNFLEKNRCVFQEVAQQNDFGKDAYVDLGHSDGVITYLCAALQVKSGESYRSSGGDYFIPLDEHAETWRFSTVPVFGVVFDPSDKRIRWIDLTGYLRQYPDLVHGRVPVSRDSILDESSLHGEFRAALASYSASGLGSLTFNLLCPGSRQLDGVSDAFALGRFDSRYLLILRRLLLDLRDKALVLAIVRLSYVGYHSDIFWTKENWISEAIKVKVRPTLVWSPEELTHMLKCVEHEDWGRGTLGQCVDVLLTEDANVVPKLELAVRMLLDDEEELKATRAAILCLTQSDDQRAELDRLSTQFPVLLKHDWFRDVAATVRQWGAISMY